MAKGHRGIKTHYLTDKEDFFKQMPNGAIVLSKCGNWVKADMIVAEGEEPTCELCLPVCKRMSSSISWAGKRRKYKKILRKSL